jgi:membrane protein implicated in regulation of membrane protease activity
MTILYSQFKTFNETSERTSQAMPTGSKLLLFIGTAFVVLTSFFLALFLIAISLVLLPFAAFRLWLFKRKIQKYDRSNSQYSDVLNTSERDNSIIEAEFTVIDSESNKT